MSTAGVFLQREVESVPRKACVTMREIEQEHPILHLRGVFGSRIPRMLVDAKAPTIFIRSPEVATHLAGLLGP